MVQKYQLKKASEENVKRLAKYLQLDIKDMSKRQIVKLVRWRITRHKRDRYG